MGELWTRPDALVCPWCLTAKPPDQGPHCWWENKVCQTQRVHKFDSPSTCVSLNTLRNSYWLVFIFRLGISPVIPTMQCWYLILIGHHVTAAWSVSDSKFSATLADVSDPMANDPFPFKIFMSPLCCLCWIWYVLIHESKFSWIVCGLQCFTGGHWYSFFPQYGKNSSIRAAILMWHLGYLWMLHTCQFL